MTARVGEGQSDAGESWCQSDAVNSEWSEKERRKVLEWIQYFRLLLAVSDSISISVIAESGGSGGSNQ